MKDNNAVTVELLKKDVENYFALEKENANGWEWYCTCAIKNLTKNEEITTAYIRQMTKEEFDVTVSLAEELFNYFKNKEMVLLLIGLYEKFYANGNDKDDIYHYEIEPLKQRLK